jgi:hypothetical protein
MLRVMMLMMMVITMMMRTSAMMMMARVEWLRVSSRFVYSYAQRKEQSEASKKKKASERE